MPLTLFDRSGYWYIRGTVSLGKESQPVYESTRIGVGEKRSRQRANDHLSQREAEIREEIRLGPQSRKTFAEAAVDYLERRRRRLEAENPRFDPEAGDPEGPRVLDLLTFFRDVRKVADRPMRFMTTDDVEAYFRWRHFDRGNKLRTAQRDESTYLAIMNNAARLKWVGADFPRADLGNYDPLKKPVVGKYFEPAEIVWMIENAPRHFQPIAALGFATGRRTSDLAWLARPGRYDETKHSGELRLERGREHIFLGYTKNGEPMITYLPDWCVPILHAHLARREDRHPELFLTDKGEPYKRPKRQQGGVFKKAFGTLRRRLARHLLLEARKQPHGTLDRQHLVERSRVVRQATPHWFRHNAASHLFMNGGSRAEADKHLGWKDPRMSARYEHMSPQHGKRLANKVLTLDVIEGGKVEQKDREAG